MQAQEIKGEEKKEFFGTPLKSLELLNVSCVMTREGKEAQVVELGTAFQREIQNCSDELFNQYKTEILHCVAKTLDSARAQKQ